MRNTVMLSSATGLACLYLLVLSASGTDTDCASDEVKCATNNQCVHNSWTCDGEEDCDDGSDEEGCAKCQRGAIKCKRSDRSNMACVPFKYLCDGDRDCTNGKDERHCSSGRPADNSEPQHSGLPSSRPTPGPRLVPIGKGLAVWVKRNSNKEKR